MPAINGSILALDVGAARIGVAVTHVVAKLPRPLITLDARDEALMDVLQSIVESEDVRVLVVGWPRGLEGQSTQQTRAIEEFAVKLRERFAIPLYMQDEALTSKHAEEELNARGKPYDKGDIDALAATYILEDFLQNHTKELQV